MRCDAAIIGGTGIGSRLQALGGDPIHWPTRFGIVRGRLLEIVGCRLLVLSRHSAGHRVPPHKVAYPAIAEAVRSSGASQCFATAAVGSLRTDWGPGTFAVCTDFVDLSGRNLTAFAHSVVHTDMTQPFSARGNQSLLQAAERQGVAIQSAAVYVNGNGPRYETPREVQLLGFAGDVVGMTAGSEAIAMRELGVPYSCLAIVTNLGAGLSATQLDHSEVESQMNRSGESAVNLLLEAATQCAKRATA